LTWCANPWNAVYKLASNKTKRSQTMTTLQKPDGSLTSDLNETLKVMIDHLSPNDKQSDDTDHHKESGPYLQNPSEQQMTETTPLQKSKTPYTT